MLFCIYIARIFFKLYTFLLRHPSRRGFVTVDTPTSGLPKIRITGPGALFYTEYRWLWFYMLIYEDKIFIMKLMLHVTAVSI